jgi:DNA-binding HxlR family transcriptional regulator
MNAAGRRSGGTLEARDRSPADSEVAGSGGGVASTECDAALVRAVDLLGKRWNALILDVLRGGPRGFSSVRRAVGPITDSVLSDRLNELAGAGVVERLETGDRPARITYALTERGTALMPTLEGLARWAADNLDCAPSVARAEKTAQ